MRSGRLAGICRCSALAVITLMAAFSVSAEQYMAREEFLQLAFAGGEPQMQTLWINNERRQAARDAVGLAPAGLRLRYWGSGERTAWILEEIGKDQPITIGISIEGDRIERVEVLAFRESRGWEIRYPFFTDQFAGLELAADGYLSEPVDGITGATLSVRAVDRAARLALWLNAQVSS
jgi:hypothetical protein